MVSRIGEFFSCCCFHFRISLPEIFSLPGDHFLAQPCIRIMRIMQVTLSSGDDPIKMDRTRYRFDINSCLTRSQLPTSNKTALGAGAGQRAHGALPPRDLLLRGAAPGDPAGLRPGDRHLELGEDAPGRFHPHRGVLRGAWWMRYFRSIFGDCKLTNQLQIENSSQEFE